MARAWAEKLPSGRWRGCYRDPRTGHKRYTTGQPGHPYSLKRQALDTAAELLRTATRTAQIEQGTGDTSMTWGQWWQIHSAARIRPHSDSGYVEVSRARRHILPRWADVPLNQVTRAGVVQWVTVDLAPRPGMSPAYAAQVYATFRRSILAAVEAELLDASPLVGIPAPKPPRRAQPYLSRDTADTYRRYLHPAVADALEFQGETGLRPGELCGLHADRLDLDRGWVLVAEVLVMRTGRGLVVRGYPKDGDSRMVPLTDRAAEVAARQLAGRDPTVGCGVPHVDGTPCTVGLVWPNPVTGRAMTPRYYRDALRKAAERAGLPRRSPYAVRRGFATTAAEGGLGAFALADIMGHSDVNITSGYVQRTEQTRAALAAALGRQAGADPGAKPHRTPPDEVGPGGARDAG